MKAEIGDGILAVWNDCRVGAEPEYEAWYEGEHLQERLAVPGFQTARRYRSLLDRSPVYFTYYETASADVLTSAPYRARLQSPTPMTRRIMSGIFLNMTRAICRRVDQAGAATGPIVVTVCWLTTVPPAAQVGAHVWLSRLQPMGAAGCALWQADRKASEPSAEELIRGRDRNIAGCLIVFFDDRAQASAIVTRLTAELADTGAEFGSYALIAPRPAGSTG